MYKIILLSLVMVLNCAFAEDDSDKGDDVSENIQERGQEESKSVIKIDKDYFERGKNKTKLSYNPHTYNDDGRPYADSEKIVGGYYGVTGIDLGAPEPDLPVKKEVVEVSKPIVVDGTFDGEGKIYKWVGQGDLSQKEGMEPMFILKPGANLKNVHMIGAPDGIHALGNNVIDHVVNNNVGEDAISFWGDNITVKNSYFRGAADKILQISAGDNHKIYNNVFIEGKRAIRVRDSKNIDIKGNKFYNVFQPMFFSYKSTATIKNNQINGGFTFLKVSNDAKVTDLGGHSVKNLISYPVTISQNAQILSSGKNTAAEWTKSGKAQIDPKYINKASKLYDPPKDLFPTGIDYTEHIKDAKVSQKVSQEPSNLSKDYKSFGLPDYIRKSANEVRDEYRDKQDRSGSEREDSHRSSNKSSHIEEHHNSSSNRPVHER